EEEEEEEEEAVPAPGSAAVGAGGGSGSGGSAAAGSGGSGLGGPGFGALGGPLGGAGQRLSGRRDVAGNELLVRLDPPARTLNPLRLRSGAPPRSLPSLPVPLRVPRPVARERGDGEDDDDEEDDEEEEEDQETRVRVPPSLGLHPANYTVKGRTGRRYSALDKSDWPEWEALHDAGVLPEASLAVLTEGSAVPDAAMSLGREEVEAAAERADLFGSASARPVFAEEDKDGDLGFGFGLGLDYGEEFSRQHQVGERADPYPNAPDEEQAQRGWLRGLWEDDSPLEMFADVDSPVVDVQQPAAAQPAAEGEQEKEKSVEEERAEDRTENPAELTNAQQPDPEEEAAFSDDADSNAPSIAEMLSFQVPAVRPLDPELAASVAAMRARYATDRHVRFMDDPLGDDDEDDLDNANAITVPARRRVSRPVRYEDPGDSEYDPTQKRPRVRAATRSGTRAPRVPTGRPRGRPPRSGLAAAAAAAQTAAQIAAEVAAPVVPTPSTVATAPTALTVPAVPIVPAVATAPIVPTVPIAPTTPAAPTIVSPPAPATVSAPSPSQGMPAPPQSAPTTTTPGAAGEETTKAPEEAAAKPAPKPRASRKRKLQPDDDDPSGRPIKHMKGPRGNRPAYSCDGTKPMRSTEGEEMTRAEFNERYKPTELQYRPGGNTGGGVFVVIATGVVWSFIQTPSDGTAKPPSRRSTAAKKAVVAGAAGAAGDGQNAGTNPADTTAETKPAETKKPARRGRGPDLGNGATHVADQLGNPNNTPLWGPAPMAPMDSLSGQGTLVGSSQPVASSSTTGPASAPAKPPPRKRPSRAKPKDVPTTSDATTTAGTGTDGAAPKVKIPRGPRGPYKPRKPKTAPAQPGTTSPSAPFLPPSAAAPPTLPQSITPVPVPVIPGVGQQFGQPFGQHVGQHAGQLLAPTPVHAPNPFMAPTHPPAPMPTPMAAAPGPKGPYHHDGFQPHPGPITGHTSTMPGNNMSGNNNNNMPRSNSVPTQHSNMHAPPHLLPAQPMLSAPTTRLPTPNTPPAPSNMMMPTPNLVPGPGRMPAPGQGMVPPSMPGPGQPMLQYPYPQHLQRPPRAPVPRPRSLPKPLPMPMPAAGTQPVSGSGPSPPALGSVHTHGQPVHHAGPVRVHAHGQVHVHAPGPVHAHAHAHAPSPIPHFSNPRVAELHSRCVLYNVAGRDRFNSDAEFLQYAESMLELLYPDIGGRGGGQGGYQQPPQPPASFGRGGGGHESFY
ncbi:uncharacterized protein C8A04DRAFT_30048, partial [Dichotomopilus funicola]